MTLSESQDPATKSNQQPAGNGGSNITTCHNSNDAVAPVAAKDSKLGPANPQMPKNKTTVPSPTTAVAAAAVACCCCKTDRVPLFIPGQGPD